MTAATRRIPICVEPVKGEALDSWLEALARRTHTSWGDLLCAVGLNGPLSARWLPAWMIELTLDQRAVLHRGTGVGARETQRMTLSQFEDRALAISDTRASLDATFPWSPRLGSRYCPHCLSESEGRWQLAWRLGWTFACLKHRCLLVDNCPCCGMRPRTTPRIEELIPEASRCPAPASDRSSRSLRCNAALTTAATHAFDDDANDVLQTQRWINAIIAGELPTTELCASRFNNCREMLQAIRAVAVKALVYAIPTELDSLVEPGLMAVYQQEHPQLPTGERRSTNQQLIARSPRSASLSAVGALAAWNCLTRPDVQSAGEAMRWIVTAMRARRTQPVPANLLGSSVIADVQLAALGPSLKPSDQLRYRTITHTPAVPTRRRMEVSQLACKIPDALWPRWSLPFLVQGCHHRQLRPALSVGLLLVGAPVGLYQAAQLLRNPISGQGISRILQLLRKHEAWPEISRALIALADAVGALEVPIDYQRRRVLDYRTLLPDEVWFRICRESDTAAQGPARATVVRAYLQERLSGGLWEGESITAAQRTKISDFPYHLTPELSEALDNHAADFLGQQGVHDEPVHYEPLKGYLREMRLPGPNVDDAKAGILHQYVQDGLTLGYAAELAGIQLETARYLLTCYPAPALPNGESGAYYRARRAYPRHRFIGEYEAERKSLRDIANDAGVSRQTMARLAADYGIELRNAGRTLKQTVERDWLYTEYVVHRRPLPDLAQEKQVSTSTMARWAKSHSIPLRPRGGGSHVRLA